MPEVVEGDSLVPQTGPLQEGRKGPLPEVGGVCEPAALSGEHIL